MFRWLQKQLDLWALARVGEAERLKLAAAVMVLDADGNECGISETAYLCVVNSGIRVYSEVPILRSGKATSFVMSVPSLRLSQRETWRAAPHEIHVQQGDSVVLTLDASHIQWRIIK